MKLEDARLIAVSLVDTLRPYCEKIEIAGSIRRGKADVKDIEIVAEPMLVRPLNLFGDPGPWKSRLVDFLDRKDDQFASPIKGDQKYRQYELPQEIKLDLFMVTPPAQWGVIYAIRTGPAEYSRWLVTRRRSGGALPSYLQVRDGGVWRGQELIPTPTERSFFQLLGLDYIRPENRRPKW